MSARHSVTLLLCTEPDALVGSCGGAMSVEPAHCGDFGCEACDRPLNEVDLDLDPGESLAIDPLDGRVYIVTCPSSHRTTSRKE